MLWYHSVMKANPEENPIIIKCKAADTLPIDVIMEFQGDLKRLSAKNRERLVDSICRRGFIAPFFLWDDRSDYRLLDGHQRLKVLLWMREQGWNIPLLPVAYIEAENEADARSKLLAITSQYGEFNMDELEGWLEDLDSEMAETIRLVDEELDLGLNGPEEETTGDDEVNDDVPTVTKLGDVWELGPHRLMCGDSTEEEDVAELMDGQKAALSVTDPPYNVAVNDESEESPKARNRRTDGLKIENDKMSNEDFMIFLKSVFCRYIDFMHDGGSIYVFYADSMTVEFMTTFKEAGFHFAQNCIWNKQQFVMTRKDYHYKHEPVMYGWKKGSAHSWQSDRKQSSVWNFDRPFKSDLHPTMKPIDLIVYPINNSSAVGSIVLDLFGGSGSTLVACEKTNRIARLMELDPHYCDVIVNRYRDWMVENDREFTIKLNGEEWHA